MVNTKKIHGPQPQDEYTKEAKYPPIKQYKTRDDEEEVIKYSQKNDSPQNQIDLTTFIRTLY